MEKKGKNKDGGQHMTFPIDEGQVGACDVRSINKGFC